MAVVRKKQEDKQLVALRELVTSGGGNRQCFDCGQKGPTYVNMTIGSFVCSRCSGLLRGLTPPHRVKSISMATFTQEEIEFLKAHGNDICAKTWLGLWDPKRVIHQDQRELMIDKYERKRYYLEPASPLKSLTNAASLKTNASAVIQNNSNCNSNSTNGNSGNKSNAQAMMNGQQKSQLQHDHSFQNIQLTPPTSHRHSSSSNGLNKSSSTAISRPQHHLQNGFHQQQDAFMLSNGLNGFSTLGGVHVASSTGSASTGALSDTSSCTSNGFGPEADFVVDFGSANIFDATSASSVGSPAVSSASSIGSSNGYAKINPIKQQHQQHQQHQRAQTQFLNGDANAKATVSVNGCGVSNGTHNSNNTTTVNGNTENFADFDHAPIFNAAADYEFVRMRIIKQKPHLSASPSSPNLVLNMKRLKEHQQQQQQQPQQSQHKYQIESTLTSDFLEAEDDDDFFSNLRAAITASATSASNHAMHDNNDCGSTASSHGNSNRVGMSAGEALFSESSCNLKDAFDESNFVSTNCNYNNHNNNMSMFESDFGTIAALMIEQQQRQPQPQTQTQTQTQTQQHQPEQQHDQEHLAQCKFTPLAMAAHATAMAVLGSNYHFNSSDNNNNGHNSSSNNFQSHNESTATGHGSTCNGNLQSTMSQPSRFDYRSGASAGLTEDNDVTACSWNDYPFPVTPPPQRRDNRIQWLERNGGTSNCDVCGDDVDERSNRLPSIDNLCNGIARLTALDYPAAVAAITTTIPTPTPISTTMKPTITPRVDYSNAFFHIENNNGVGDSDCKYFGDESAEVASTLANFTYASCVAPAPLDQVGGDSANVNDVCSKLSPLNPFLPYLLHPSQQARADECSSPVGIFARNTSSTSVAPNSLNMTHVTPCPIVSCTPESSSTFPSTSTTVSTSFCSPSSIYCCCCTTHTSAHTAPIDSNANRSASPSFRKPSTQCCWRLPIPNGSSATSANNNSSQTPAEDRYAALKDLDEQLRESKAMAEKAASIVASSVVDSFGNISNNNNTGNNNACNGNHINPFKSQAMPMPLANPFQGANASQQQNLYVQAMQVIPPNGLMGNATPPTQAAFFNYNGNGYVTSASSVAGPGGVGPSMYPVPGPPPVVASGPNGCGFGFGTMQQQMAVTNGIGSGAFNNPFAATGGFNTNNPFL